VACLHDGSLVVGSTLAYTNTGCLNMDDCLIIVVLDLICLVFDAL
jgi:hypothetical protein